jgi:acyl-coenzyme A thioesterase PaaI-like protein
VTDQQRRAVADRLRAIADRAATDDLTPEGWADVLAHLAQAEQVFAADSQERTRFARAFADDARHPIEEGSSGVYPPIDVDITDHLLVARIRFGPAWEGPPDLVHGGFLAAGFDMCLSAMAHHVLGHSVTRRLQVRYLKPTFVGADLRYEVEADEPEGRLLSLRGRLFSGDQVTMRASAQFASLDQTRFADRRPVRPAP